jgi:hypothetical protein
LLLLEIRLAPDNAIEPGIVGGVFQRDVACILRQVNGIIVDTVPAAGVAEHGVGERLAREGEINNPSWNLNGRLKVPVSDLVWTAVDRVAQARVLGATSGLALRLSNAPSSGKPCRSRIGVRVGTPVRSLGETAWIWRASDQERSPERLNISITGP